MCWATRTNKQVSKILAKIVTTGKEKLKSVYDPTCGSGSLLLRVAKEAKVSEYYGQEMTRTTYNLARMNMILHGVHYREFSIKHDDTLEHPQHLDRRFEAIVANPPFSAHWKGDDNPINQNDPRFSQYGDWRPRLRQISPLCSICFTSWRITVSWPAYSHTVSFSVAQRRE